MKAGKLGALSAVTASLCCLGPAALAAIGLGGLAAGAGFARLVWISLGLTTVLLALGWRFYWAEVRTCKAAKCRMAGGPVTLSILVTTSVIAGILALVHLWPTFNKAACGLTCLR